MHLDRPLDPVELRILGSLAEKQLSTPEYYPLTLNALIAACNQKTNREPVMELGEEEVRRAVERLQELQLVWQIHGGRAVRYDHRLDGRWGLTPATKAIVAVLFLRGPQTAGEIRTRSERLHRFGTIEEVEAELRYLAQGDEALVTELPRRPGQKEARWAHLAAGSPAADDQPAAPVTASPLSERVARLEEALEELRAEVRSLRDSLGG